MNTYPTTAEKLYYPIICPIYPACLLVHIIIYRKIATIYSSEKNMKKSFMHFVRKFTFNKFFSEKTQWQLNYVRVVKLIINSMAYDKIRSIHR